MSTNSPGLSSAHSWTDEGPLPEMWVQEEIFGHRFIEEQKPYMLVLEVLVVCESVLRDDGKLFATRAPSISIAKRGPLRYLLFEDSSLDQLKSKDDLTSDDKLERFVSELNEGYRGRTSRVDAFNYLRDRFVGQFQALAQSIDILRSMEIDSMTSRRWTSRFLAPIGPQMLLSDVDHKLIVDRRFFGRGGEVMYHMISRSKKSNEVADLIVEEFFKEVDPINQLLERVDSKENDRSGSSRLGYLPDNNMHEAYDRLAEDWVAVLSLKGLPSSHKFEPLSRLTALNLVRYFLECAAKAKNIFEDEDQFILEPIILDVSGGELKDLRQKSISHLRRVRETVDESVSTYIKYTLEKQTPKWQQALKHSDMEAQFRLAVEAIEETFKTKILSREFSSTQAPEDCLNFFINKATSRSRNNISTLIEPMGKNSGFITARRGLGTWFDASDEFLEALVIGNTGKKPITVNDFLENIYQKYRIVIGLNEASKEFVKRTFEPLSFEDNMKIFERRLTGLGYVKRLSDDCAFVSNPYAV